MSVEQVPFRYILIKIALFPLSNDWPRFGKWVGQPVPLPSWAVATLWDRFTFQSYTTYTYRSYTTKKRSRGIGLYYVEKTGNVLERFQVNPKSIPSQFPREFKINWDELFCCTFIFISAVLFNEWIPSHFEVPSPTVTDNDWREETMVNELDVDASYSSIEYESVPPLDENVPFG